MFDVLLTSAENPEAVAQALKKLTSKPIKECRKLVEAYGVLVSGVTKERANEIVEALNEAGAECKVRLGGPPVEEADPIDSAYNAGRAAHAEGRVLMDGPHEPEEVRLAWRRGWNSAATIAAGKLPTSAPTEATLVEGTNGSCSFEGQGPLMDATRFSIEECDDGEGGFVICDHNDGRNLGDDKGEIVYLSREHADKALAYAIETRGEALRLDIDDGRYDTDTDTDTEDPEDTDDGEETDEPRPYGVWTLDDGRHVVVDQRLAVGLTSADLHPEHEAVRATFSKEEEAEAWEKAEQLERAEREESLPPELTNETWLQNYIDIANRDCEGPERTEARLKHREWMRENGVGDSMVAASRRLVSGLKTKGRALIIEAAVHIRDEGREGKHEVSTADGGSVAAQATGKGKKRRGGGKPKGPPKSRRSHAFYKRLGSSAVMLKVPAGLDVQRLLDLLHQGAFDHEPVDVTATPVYGWCRLDEPMESVKEIESLPTLGSDPRFVVFGLRCDVKKGCPTKRFRAEAEREETAAAKREGKEQASGKAFKEATDSKVNRWYASATPTTTVVPVVYHRDELCFSVHSSNAADVSAAITLIGNTVGQVDRLASPLDAAPKELNRTSLRNQDLAATGEPDLGSDFLLWLSSWGFAGKGEITLEDGTLGFWLDDSIDLERTTTTGGKQKVKLTGAPCEGSPLAASLMEGGAFKAARLTMKWSERQWSMDIAGGRDSRWRLPTEVKPDGTPAGLDAAIDERLRTWLQGRGLLDALVERFLTQRLDKGSWNQRLRGTQRHLADSVDGATATFRKVIQMPLFADGLVEKAEAHSNGRGGARGRRAQAEA